MTRFDDDRELDDFLARRSALNRRLAEHDPTEPPPELDRLVLDKARDAIETPAPVPVYRAPRWALPVSLAATVVLALAVVVNYGRMQQGGYPVAASASPAAGAAVPEAEMKPLLAPAAPPAPEPQLAAKSTESFGASGGSVPAELRRANADQADADKEAARVASNDAARMPPAVHAASDTAATGAPTSTPLLASRSAGVVHAPSEARAIAPAKREMAATSAIPESLEVTAARHGRAESTSGAPLTAAADEVTAVRPLAPAPAAEKAKHTDPQAWLREIERLRAAGRMADAERELAEFRKTFPAEAVPAAARDPRPAQ